jgi:Fe-S cluster biogenesis protein NfuA/nitrite reductase/ring-hydroxylating ferredoxin subunit
VTQQTRPSSSDLRAVGERIDALIDASAANGPVARERAEELVRLVVDLYGAGLERLLEIVHEHGGLDASLEALARDDLVASLLLVHGLHPHDVTTRVRHALETVRPYLGSHGGDVKLLSIDGGVVRLRMLGSCDGCPSSSVTLKLAVEGAIEAAAPEVSAIEVEAATGQQKTGPTISVESLFARVGEPDAPPLDGGSSWEQVPELVALAPGGVASVEVAGVPLIACRVGTDRYAFRDRCAQCGQPMHGATIGRRLGGSARDGVLQCPACRAHFDVRRAGACLDRPDLHLDPLPLLSDGVTVSIAVPQSVPA